MTTGATLARVADVPVRLALDTTSPQAYCAQEDAVVDSAPHIARATA